MILIIDGYNILKQIKADPAIHENERKNFTNHLIAYAKIKHHSIIVVFDGGPFWWSSGTTTKNVTTVYSGTRENADDYIKKYIEASKHPDNLLLVSSDRELIDFAQKNNVHALRAQEFLTILERTLPQQTIAVVKSTEKAYKMKDSPQNSELDQLMAAGSSTIMLKKEDLARTKQPIKSNKLVKKDRKKQQKLKKL